MTYPTPRLGRYREFDARSLRYPIVNSLELALPPRSNLWKCSAIFNQRFTNACVGFAFGHELAATPKAVTGISERWLERKIYWEAQKVDSFPGGEYPGADQPFTGTSLLAGAKVIQRLGFCREYRWAATLDQLIRGLAKGPAVLGVTWYEGMLEADRAGFVSPTGDPVGGHAFCVLGNHHRAKRFICRNSWGQYWGKLGDFYLSYADMADLLADGGEACFLVGRRGGAVGEKA